MVRALALLFALAGCRQLLGLTPPELADAAAGDATGDHVTSPRKLSLPSDVIMDMPAPILVVLDATRIDYSVIQDPNTDLEFYDPTYAVTLPFEVEEWNPKGRSYVWVRWGGTEGTAIPRFVHMMFGPNLRGAQLPTVPWDAYELVHHFTSSLQSSASDLYKGTMIGATLAPMMMGHGVQLSGMGAQEVTFNDSQRLFDLWNQYTLEMWVRPDYTDPSAVTAQSVLEQGGGFAGAVIEVPNGSAAVVAQFQYADGSTTKDPIATPIGEWTYAVWTYDGKEYAVYRNGMRVPANPVSEGAVLLHTTGSFQVGSSQLPMFGAIDELRVARGSFTASYFRAQYLSGMDHLLTFGDP